MKTFIKYLLLSIIVLGGVFASIYFLLLPSQLNSYTYTTEQIALIRENDLVYDFVRAGKSTLMSTALNNDAKNIERTDLYLVKDTDLPENVDYEHLYTVMSTLSEKGYDNEQVMKLIKSATLDELHILMDSPLPVNMDVLYSALDKKFPVVQAYQLSNMDRDLSSLIMNDGTDYSTTVKLNNMGYSVEDIKALNKLGNTELNMVTVMKYLADLPTLVSNESFDMKLLPRYIMAIENEGYEAEDAIVYVNDNEDYVDVEDIDMYGLYSDDFRTENPGSYTALVNKNHYLNADYAPTDITEFSHEEMRTDVATALGSLFTALNEQKFETIIVDVGYVSYSEQEELFNRYLEMFEDDEEKALERTPYAGYSEHQTGLAVDFYIRGSNFEDYEGYQWMLDNIHNYGFILRYPAGKEFLTGFPSEPKHFRFVGVEAAKIMHDYEWTLEEYKTIFE